MNIRRDSYNAWLHNDVTKRFLHDIMLSLKDTTESKIYGKTSDEIIKLAHERNAKMQALEYVLKWTPNELL